MLRLDFLIFLYFLPFYSTITHLLYIYLIINLSMCEKHVFFIFFILGHLLDILIFGYY